MINLVLLFHTLIVVQYRCTDVNGSILLNHIKQKSIHTELAQPWKGKSETIFQSVEKKVLKDYKTSGEIYVIVLSFTSVSPFLTVSLSSVASRTQRELLCFSSRKIEKVKNTGRLSILIKAPSSLFPSSGLVL